jgi:hypothetical protein
MKAMHPIQRVKMRWWGSKRYLVMGILALGIVTGKAVWDPSVESDYPGLTVARVLLSEDQLIGDRVVNPSGEMLGVINDVIIDLSDGQLTYALVSPEGFTGSSDLVVPVPWSAMGRSNNQHEFVVNVTRQQMEYAPRFFKDMKPELNEPCWDGDYQEFNNPEGPTDDRENQVEPVWPPLAHK